MSRSSFIEGGNVRYPARNPYVVIGSVVLLFAVLTIASFVLLGAGIEQWALDALGPATQQGTVALLSFALLAGDIVLPTPSSVVLAASSPRQV